MSACVGDRAICPGMRQVRILRVAVKTELHHPHPGQPAAVAQSQDVGSDHPEIFRDERHAAKLAADRFEEIGARTTHPGSGLGCRRSRGNLPGGNKTAEVIEPDNVDEFQQSAQAIEAPAVPGAFQRLPVVNRIAPKLSLRREIIRRYARDKTCAAAGVEVEEFGIRPNVARVGGDEKRQIANDSQALAPRIFLKPPGLAEKQELRESDLIDLILQFPPRARQQPMARGKPDPMATRRSTRRCIGSSARERERNRRAIVPDRSGISRTHPADRSARRGESYSTPFPIKPRLNVVTASKSTTSAGKDRPSQSRAETSPSSTSASGLIRSQLPANEDSG